MEKNSVKQLKNMKNELSKKQKQDLKPKLGRKIVV